MTTLFKNRPVARVTHAHFDRSRLPDPETYYTAELGALRGRGTWRDALCCFHQDARPSLRVNAQTGSYRCMACGASGGDVLAFQRQRYGLAFPDAAKALGAWIGGRHG
jgi:hypothetical protein